MEKVNVTELREHLPSYLAKVNAGAELEITSRGCVIARLVPAVNVKAQAQKELKTLRKKCRIGDVTSPIDAQWNAEHGRT